jgi:phenylalanyl-tRNA synthetase beta chain
VIEIGLTPNRPDCTGVCRHRPRSGRRRSRQAEDRPQVRPFAGEGDCPVKVDRGRRKPLPRLRLRLVRGVKNGPSPKWMQQRLIAIGLRPINALVDITNYITFDRGRPLHVFDADKVKGDLTVRARQEGEEPPGARRQGPTSSTPQMCVIADENGPESIGGIMGGEHSGCDENTTDVLIESALWDPINIARPAAARHHHRCPLPLRARRRSANSWPAGPGAGHQLVLEMCGGTPTQARVTGYKGTSRRSSISPSPRSSGCPVSMSDDESSATSSSASASGLRLRRDGQGRRAVLAPGRCRRQGRSRRGGHAHPWR